MKIIYKCIVGSQAYGTNVEGSDIDIKGVYIQDQKDILCFGYKPQYEVSKDEVYYEVRRFIELLQTANPTVLEMLYSPEDCIQVCEPEFKILIESRNVFLTKKCKNSFGGYAMQQVQKAKGLNKKMNWEDSEMIRKTPLDFCYMFDEGTGGSVPFKSFVESLGWKQEYVGLVSVDHIRDGYAWFYDFRGAHTDAEPLGFKGVELPNSNDIRLSSIPKDHPCLGFVHYNKDGYTQHCNKYKEYQTWLKERNTQRYVDIEGHGQKIDGKNMLHCRRLIDTAIEIATTGTVNVRRKNAKELIDIRKGKVDLESILLKANEDIAKIDEAFNKCSLPDEVSMETCSQLLEKIRYYDEKA